VCGRYILRQAALAEREFFLNRAHWKIDSSYNIAPTQSVPVVRMAHGEREGVMMRWGLIPYFAHGQPPTYSTINARIETLETAPSYRGPWKRHQRALQIASGFYEWHTDATARKAPYVVQLNDQDLFAFAALWDRSFKPDGTVIESVAHVTMPGNELMRKIHNSGSNPYRMPAILRKEDREAWLTGTIDEARAVLKPYPSELMIAYEVSPRVNSPKENDERLLDPAAKAA
jgi:putative SOS response-associated peptidase YedK